MFRFTHLHETHSTNTWLRTTSDDGDLVVSTDYQSAGRGCGTNSWESERGANLLFSIAYHPHGLTALHSYRLSMAIAVAIVEAVKQHLSADDAARMKIKWPNDIYYADRKMGGILIENVLNGQQVRKSIIGIGLNVNQQTFLSDAPNPVSLAQITGTRHDRDALLHAIIAEFERLTPLVASRLPSPTDDPLVQRYNALLYRRQGFFPYEDAEGTFEAEIIEVSESGMLWLRDTEGKERSYWFKEVRFK